MPRLPRSPNLDHLKQQAKRLLRAQRSGQPDALRRAHAQEVRAETFRLADAQWIVAREYGFPDWPRLKMFVETAAEVSTSESYVPLKTAPSRRQFVHDLADVLLAAAEHGDTAALGKRLAATPLRDILAARAYLLETDDLNVIVRGLVEGLEHPKPRVRFNCAGALDHLADERCAEPLRRRLDDPVPRVRRAALHSLSCDACKLSPLTHTGDLVPKLISMALHDPSIQVRRAAVPVLASYCQDTGVVQTLRSLAQVETDASILRNARRALRRLG